MKILSKKTASITKRVIFNSLSGKEMQGAHPDAKEYADLASIQSELGTLGANVELSDIDPANLTGQEDIDHSGDDFLAIFEELFGEQPNDTESEILSQNTRYHIAPIEPPYTELAIRDQNGQILLTSNMDQMQNIVQTSSPVLDTMPLANDNDQTHEHWVEIEFEDQYGPAKGYVALDFLIPITEESTNPTLGDDATDTDTLDETFESRVQKAVNLAQRSPTTNIHTGEIDLISRAQNNTELMLGLQTLKTAVDNHTTTQTTPPAAGTQGPPQTNTSLTAPNTLPALADVSYTSDVADIPGRLTAAQAIENELQSRRDVQKLFYDTSDFFNNITLTPNGELALSRGDGAIQISLQSKTSISTNPLNEKGLSGTKQSPERVSTVLALFQAIATAQNRTIPLTADPSDFDPNFDQWSIKPLQYNSTNNTISTEFFDTSGTSPTWRPITISASPIDPTILADTDAIEAFLNGSPDTINQTNFNDGIRAEFYHATNLFGRNTLSEGFSADVSSVHDIANQYYGSQIRYLQNRYGNDIHKLNRTSRQPNDDSERLLLVTQRTHFVEFLDGLHGALIKSNRSIPSQGVTNGTPDKDTLPIQVTKNGSQITIKTGDKIIYKGSLTHYHMGGVVYESGFTNTEFEVLKTTLESKNNRYGTSTNYFAELNNTINPLG